MHKQDHISENYMKDQEIKELIIHDLQYKLKFLHLKYYYLQQINL